MKDFNDSLKRHKRHHESYGCARHHQRRYSKHLTQYGNPGLAYTYDPLKTHKLIYSLMRDRSNIRDKTLIDPYLWA
ncbi:hypothetical protein LCGC14_2107110, partial [marine sediment metagenome]